MVRRLFVGASTAATEANDVPERLVPALRRLIAEIDDMLDVSRDPVELIVLLDRRKALRGALAELSKLAKERKARAQAKSDIVNPS